MNYKRENGFFLIFCIKYQSQNVIFLFYIYFYMHFFVVCLYCSARLITFLISYFLELLLFFGFTNFIDISYHILQYLFFILCILIFGEALSP